MISVDTGDADALAGWLERLASPDPTPGGGAAAAVGLSMAAGLIEMACAVSRSKTAEPDVGVRLSALRSDGADARRRSQALAADDARAFDAVIAAYRMPKATDNQKQTRRTAIQTALRQAAEPPLETARLSLTVIDIATSALNDTHDTIVSDIGVAAILARAALEASLINVEVNLAAVADPAWRVSIAADMETCRSGIAAADQLAATVRARIAA